MACHEAFFMTAMDLFPVSAKPCGMEKTERCCIQFYSITPYRQKYFLKMAQKMDAANGILPCFYSSVTIHLNILKTDNISAILPAYGAHRMHGMNAACRPAMPFRAISACPLRRASPKHVSLPSPAPPASQAGNSPSAPAGKAASPSCSMKKRPLQGALVQVPVRSAAASGRARLQS